MADTPSPPLDLSAKVETRLRRPSVGRIVRYFPDPFLDKEMVMASSKSAPFRAAIISDVIEGGGGENDIVTLTVFHPQHGAMPTNRYVREGTDDEPGTWHWPEVR